MGRARTTGETKGAFGGARVSRQRRAIASAAARFGSAFTVERLHAAVTDAGEPAGLATVYRAVTALVDAGSLVGIGTRDGSALYAWCGRDDHHHHFVCTRCGAVRGIECPLGESALGAVRGEGYTVTGHDVTLYGLCPDCRHARDGATP
ncbi:MAG: Fur family transcriptional regulator [Anaerosomatales bacterium]|nr:Fur family transcriptional regulator [Anaerosomatales bacterium]